MSKYWDAEFLLILVVPAVFGENLVMDNQKGDNTISGG